jgi:hypothetical protein
MTTACWNGWRSKGTLIPSHDKARSVNLSFIFFEHYPVSNLQLLHRLKVLTLAYLVSDKSDSKYHRLLVN